ncbi:chromosome partitioning protein ParB [Sphingomonas koreensis]|uniref:Chromosome partitioning protein ParB n=1 Tax=Sphingomonas koreensis TaxID=93064 RepID=A0A1L6J848_9SPHN|nr:ParB N-terminal domain-containing protein [Sphingomonas koreensis]APR52122.1 chromosome partitioning protein ParB [Sphingomonas koreensis]RSU22931.1 chromosome partitioning protein ParB [Sphingomonas koreensis]RSU26796.1 chromosome partitioning protein ParB [Sphingomonas koreensis]RSU30595.1 chromosome partitioning protein ParB [Sphingomonas koreensis]RSU36960.1 chromosome partitioning protein ParB [Sphingomonas koreensis]
MTLMFIAQDRLSVSKTNMRHSRRATDVGDILPTIRKRGVIQTLLVRPCQTEGDYEIVAGARRFHAARLVAVETGEAEPLPCRVLEAGDDAAAIEASMIENLARLDADEVTQWETFTRLVREGREVADISETFGLPDLTIRRVLALGNLMPRIRDLYRREEIDRATVRHLTMASKAQQRSWLALLDDPNAYVPTGHNLKAWLLGGQSISAAHALFDLDAFKGALVSDLFGEDRYFADADAFWTAQNAAIDERRTAYLEAGWSDVVIVPPGEHFSPWEYEKTAKRKGGRIYVDVRANGEVSFHEGYLTRAEARRVARGEPVASGEKPARPEITSAMQTYVDLHRHAAVRAAMCGHGGVALRLMVAHAIVGSPLWTVRPDAQSTRNDDVRESVETSLGETRFDEHRRAVLAVLDFSPDEPIVTGGNGDDHGLCQLFHRLLELPDGVVLDIVAMAMGETLAVGSAAVDAVGNHLAIDMADWWGADAAFFDLVRDREVSQALLAEIAGDVVAKANEKEKAKTVRKIARDHIAGADGRTKVERWVPRWMRFPPAAYTARGGVGTVAAAMRAARVEPEREAEKLAA